MMATNSTVKVDPTGKTSCAGCDRSIPAGAYRVVLMAVEIDGLNGRGESTSTSYCKSCIAELPVLEMGNWFKLLMDARIKDVLESSPRSEDAMYRAESGNREEKVSGGRTMDRRGDGDDEVGMADQEAIKFSDHVGPGQAAIKGEVPLVVRTVASVRRETLQKFLADQASRGKMKPVMREAASLYATGIGQSEIALKLKVDQATVSRMIQGALKIANAAS
jgi:hypothetical protein